MVAMQPRSRTKGMTQGSATLGVRADSPRCSRNWPRKAASAARIVKMRMVLDWGLAEGVSGGSNMGMWDGMPRCMRGAGLGLGDCKEGCDTETPEKGPTGIIRHCTPV